jgi:hypothetical protein
MGARFVGYPHEITPNDWTLAAARLCTIPSQSRESNAASATAGVQVCDLHNRGAAVDDVSLNQRPHLRGGNR